MRRPIHLTFLAIVAVAVTTWACGDAEVATPTSPTTPTTTTETFSDNLTPSGAKTFPFEALAGTVTATLTSLGPDSTLSIGMSLGTWSGTVCQIVLRNDNAVQGSVVTGTVSAAGNLCLSVYDAAGQLVEPIAFVVTVVHP